MRKRDSDNLTQRGNAMIYILIAIALIGFLTITLNNQNEQSDSQNIDDEIAELYALELIEYAATAKSVIDQMEITGTSFDEFDFINPTSATPFNTAPHIHKVFHPQGGGFTYKNSNAFPTGTFLSTTGWQFADTTNIEWTPTTADDMILTAIDINQTVCEGINEKITGSITIPVSTVTLANLFLESTASTDLTATNCASCEGYPSLCLEDSAGDYGFYNIMFNR
ncbi:MAG: hypothetical protein AAF569_01130 [Pseudomonadota bacterium]